jgi:hypothetical protein
VTEQPEGGVTAAQVTLTALDEVALADTVGADGAAAQTWVLVVVTERAELAGETLPAASRAVTVKE